MAEVTLSVLSNADDGSCDSAGGGFTSNKSGGYLTIGKEITVGAQHTFFRFDNATIPAGAVIDSAILRLTSYSTGGGSTCSVKVHFEAADDPAAPTTDADLLGRSLDVGVAWSSLPSWSANVTEDSPELKTLLQDIIDGTYGSWNSGQALQVIVVDNGSSTNVNRRPASFEHSSYTPAQLVVSYSLPYQIELSDSIEISEDISIESDLITQENIELTEAENVLLGFDESLPLISENITITESVTITRGLGGVPVQSENIDLTESVTMSLGFGETLPEFSESITITEYQLIDVGPQISVFESITVNDYGNIQPELGVFENLSLAESVTVRRGYQVAVDESFSFSDNFTLFNYSKWLRENVGKLGQIFFFTLTGSADLQEDVEIPASAIYARKVSGNPTYLQVTIPSFNYANDIAIRSSGNMKVEMAYIVGGVVVLRETVLETNLEDISIYEGPTNRSVVLSGHKTVVYGGNLVSLQRTHATYKSVQNLISTY